MYWTSELRSKKSSPGSRLASGSTNLPENFPYGAIDLTKIQSVVNSSAFSAIVSVIIAVNAVLIGMETDDHGQQPYWPITRPLARFHICPLSNLLHDRKPEAVRIRAVAQPDLGGCGAIALRKCLITPSPLRSKGSRNLVKARRRRERTRKN